jgi:glycine cleavage system H protein
MAGGWFFKVKLADAAQLGGLMDSTAYDTLLKGL